MTRTGLARLFAVALAAMLTMQAAPAIAQMEAGQVLGTARIPKNVLANGQPLPAGTYSIRMAGGAVAPVVGQSPDGMQWVEFVQSGQVKGRELATVVAGPDAKHVVKGKGPAPGSAIVQMLKGNDYQRVWINRGGKHYLIHLATTPS